MNALPSSDRPETPRKIPAYLWIAARFVLGYAMAISAGAVVFTLLLLFLPNFEASPGPDGITTSWPSRFLELAAICLVLGAIFAIPYTILGSLAFWFLLPHKTPVFLLIGAFCPIAAMLTMTAVLQSRFWLEIPYLLLSIPAGLVATYVYGAVGFGQGFKRWRFA